ncbi:hypothetical protein LPJ72_004686 [Coemansia sp. Benny D160-2]|nr:hypothetical protein LPJ72_004686 [Coemansia sp. Benny D160-2]
MLLRHARRATATCLRSLGGGGRRAPLYQASRQAMHSEAEAEADDADVWGGGEIPRGAKVYVGMSGGVDSSVAAGLLKDRGYDVEAVFMRNWDTRDERGECPSERDFSDVQAVCRQLDIRCHQVSLVKQYWTAVFSVAIDAYARGLTPNPDVLCNSEIKFGVLLDHISRKIHARSCAGGRRDREWWFATGHYARTVRGRSGDILLYRGSDRRKDQSYYLAAVPSAALDHVVFPLGRLAKNEDVRRMAGEMNLPTASKEESMGICFVGERRRFDSFLAEYIPQKPGDILASDGRVLGSHRGMFSRTIGQLAGVSGMHGRWYIYAKEPHTNRMYAVQGRDSPLLMRKTVRAGPARWISGSAPPGLGLPGGIALDVQVRYMQGPQRCTAMALDQSTNTPDGCLNVEFDAPQFGVAAGQYLVLYSGDRCLGSAMIL